MPADSVSGGLVPSILDKSSELTTEAANNRVCRDRLNKLIAERKDYDAATNHGFSQGVVFP